MTHPLFSHPEGEGPSLEAPAHDGGDAASALDGLSRERTLAYARVEMAGPRHPVVMMLRQIGEVAAHWDKGEPIRFDLPFLSDDHLSLLSSVLGTGEVAGWIEQDGLITFTEAVCPGIWMVREEGSLRLEVGEVPACAHAVAATLPLLDAPEVTALPDGVMNALPVLGELHSHSAAWRPGSPAHGVNLSLLPLSPVDTMVLTHALGQGPLSFESKGYGFARIAATGRRHIWRTRFFNSQGTPIQDILEIGDIPAGASATAEDVREGGERLLSILDIYA